MVDGIRALITSSIEGEEAGKGSGENADMVLTYLLFDLTGTERKKV